MMGSLEMELTVMVSRKLCSLKGDFSKLDSIPFHLHADIDECDQGDHNCDINAQCDNTVGGFECHCNDGFTTNGTQCDGKPETDSL